MLQQLHYRIGRFLVKYSHAMRKIFLRGLDRSQQARMAKLLAENFPGVLNDKSTFCRHMRSVPIRSAIYAVPPTLPCATTRLRPSAFA